MKKEELVRDLNAALGMSPPLSHWQFGQIRRWELEEMVRIISTLREQAERYHKSPAA